MSRWHQAPESGFLSAIVDAIAGAPAKRRRAKRAAQAAADAAAEADARRLALRQTLHAAQREQEIGPTVAGLPAWAVAAGVAAVVYLVASR